jgi:hypothetical protein
MAQRRCPHCDRRLPYAGRRCIHCGWSVGASALAEGEGISWWRGRRFWSVVAAALLLLGIQFGYRNSTLLADWYANFAAQNLPVPASSFAPTDTEAGAFFFCARQVARRMDGKFSVETFPSQQESDLTALGGGRYQVHSFVDETREDGSRVRYEFVCSVTFARGRWALDQLDLTERFATTSTESPALARRD